MFSTRNSPEPYALLRNEVDQLFEDFFGTGVRQAKPKLAKQLLPASLVRRNSFPALNLWENEEKYYLEAECPGLEIDNLELSITGNQLTINGERKNEYSGETAFHRQERGTGKFTRTVALPTEVDADKVESSLKNGVLTIQLLKAEEAKPKKIKVQS